MKKIEYPKWRYHASKDPVVVETPSEKAALGEGWYDSPAKAKVEAARSRMAAARAAKAATAKAKAG